MPLPKPRKGEKQGDFVSRCIEFETNASPRRPPEQIQAMCYQAWRDRESCSPLPVMTEAEVREGYTQFPCEISFKEAVVVQDETADHPIIRNISVLGSESKNKRKYLRAAMEQAVDLYDNVKVFANHQEEGGLFGGGGPDVMKLAGKITKPVFDSEALKIRAEFHGLPNDPIADKIVRVAQHMPEIAGFSHNAKGKIHVEEGVEIVEEIKEVYSVDLVAYPATNRGMFENKEIDTMDWTKITVEELKKNRPDIAETLELAGAKGRDDEVKQVTEERDALRVENETMKLAKEQADRRIKLEETLAKSDLPDEAKTDLFKEALLAHKLAKDEKVEDYWAKMIEDRRAAIGLKSGVKNNTERKVSESDSGGMSDEEAVAELKS